MRPTYMTVVAPGHVAACLREIRSKRQYSLRDVEAISGISKSKLDRIERGFDMDARTLVTLTAFIKSHRR